MYGNGKEINGINEEGNTTQKITDVIKKLGNDEIEQMFLPVKHINGGQQNFFDFLKKMISHIHILVKKERMENDYIDKNLGKLSAREILSNGKVFYMNPCLDFVLVTIEGLKKTEIEKIDFIVDELICPGNVCKLHFGIEILYQGTIHYIDHRSKNDVFIGKGNFQSTYSDKGESVDNTIKINANEVFTDDNVYSLINKGLLPFKLFDPEILKMLTEKLKHDNTVENFEQFNIQNKERVKIHVENKK
ncbi:MAG: hypothetical protein WC010_04520 [Candidatus Absconditabacterales bacterium]